MENSYWPLASTLVSNAITIIIILFSNRTRKVDDKIEELEEDVRDIREEIPVMKKDLELFRLECKERYIKRGKK